MQCLKVIFNKDKSDLFINLALSSDGREVIAYVIGTTVFCTYLKLAMDGLVVG